MDKSKIFKLSSVKNNQELHPFDLSQSRMFSVAPGQIHVIQCLEVLPHDKFRISVDNLTRAMPLNSAAFARCKEYFNFHFVPTRLLWKYFPNMIIKNSHTDSATSITDASTPTMIPRFRLDDLQSNIESLADLDPVSTDELGFNYAQGVTTLAQELGYGYLTADNPRIPSVYVSLLPFLAYQKVYQDFYRSSQWEEYDSTSFNVDYLNSVYTNPDTNNLQISLDPDDPANCRNIFGIRYANYAKDYFTGVRPSTQFGDVSVVSVSTDKWTSDDPDSEGNLKLASAGFVDSSAEGNITLKGTFDILSLRKAEAIQRLREIQQANDFRYNAQIKALFGYEVPDYRAQLAEYIGGFSNVMKITDIDATAAGSTTDSPTLSSSSLLGQVSGKGIFGGSSDSIDFSVPEHGFIIGTYYVGVTPNYPALGIARQNLHLEYEDFYNPMYQNLGLSGVKVGELVPELTDDPNHRTYFNTDYGYSVRYLEYKSQPDYVYDEFMSGQSLSYWNTPIESSKLRQVAETGSIDYRFMKIKPDALNPIFKVYYDGSTATNPFLVNLYINIQALRPMSIDGMPY